MALCACSNNGGIQPTKIAFTLPKGFTKAESDDKSVTLAVPSGWRQGANNMFGTSNPFDMANAPAPSSSQTAEEKKTMEDLSKSLSGVINEDERRNLEKLAAKGIILHVV